MNRKLGNYYKDNLMNDALLKKRCTVIFASLLFFSAFLPQAMGDQVISTSMLNAFAAPNPPYDSDSFMVQVILGYGDDSNSIGNGVWIDQPGIYDLSSDPDFDNYVSLVTNGQLDAFWVSIIDQNDNSEDFVFDASREWMFSGSYPDIGDRTVNKIHLNVEDIFVGPEDNGGVGGIAFHVEYIGVPEPSCLLMAYLLLFISRKYR